MYNYDYVCSYFTYFCTIHSCTLLEVLTVMSTTDQGIKKGSIKGSRNFKEIKFKYSQKIVRKYRN